MKALTIAAALGAALLFAGSASAAPSAVAKACAKDVKSVCGNVKPGGGKLTACVKEHFSDLSTDCQIAIHQGRRGRAGLQGGHEEVLRRREAGPERQGGMPEVSRGRPQRRLQGRHGEGGSGRQVGFALRSRSSETRPSSTARGRTRAPRRRRDQPKEIIMKTVVSALLALGLLAGTVAEANAVVCARGVYHAGCAGPHGAVTTTGLRLRLPRRRRRGAARRALLRQSLRPPGLHLTPPRPLNNNAGEGLSASFAGGLTGRPRFVGRDSGRSIDGERRPFLERAPRSAEGRGACAPRGLL